MQVNVAPLNIVNFQRYFPDESSCWQIHAFFEEIYQVYFGFAGLEYDVVVVVEGSLRFFLSAEDGFKDSYNGFREA